MQQSSWLTWRRSGWLLSLVTCLTGLFGLAYMAWITRHGHPRGPAGAIVAGFILYAAIMIRITGGVGLLLFVRRSKAMIATLVAWGVSMCAILFLDLPPYSFGERLVFGIWWLIAFGCDVALLMQNRARTR